MKIIRKRTREINLGDLRIGGENPISVQSMTKSKIYDTAAITGEIEELTRLGCEVIRIAIPDEDAVSEFRKLTGSGIFKVPVIADIHFDHRLALECIEAGVNGIRINPGNIGGYERTARVIEAAGGKNVAVRIGINAGSIDKKVLKANQGNMQASMVQSAMENIELM